jgi:hypothetical protein
MVTELKIDDCIKVIGGKSKKCIGVIQQIRNKFVYVKLTQDKHGKPLFTETPTKVKKIYVEPIDPPPLEMPSSGDLKVVDSLEPNKDIFDTIDETLMEHSSDKLNVTFEEVAEPIIEAESDHENSNPNEIAEKKKKLAKESYMINENNVKEPVITMDDAINFRDHNKLLQYQLDSMVGFQSAACKEIAELKCNVDKLKEQLGDSVRKEKLEEIKALLVGI